MKSSLLFVFLLIPFLIQAQHSDRCGFTAHQNYQKAKNPDLAQQIIKDENLLQQRIGDQSQARITNAIYTIPVVVHILYKNNSQNVTDAQIRSQLDVLNEDFGRTNPDAASTPSGFINSASSTNFQFCLAIKDPSGNSTSGIERRQTTVTSFQADDDMKFFTSGGLDAWDVNKYMNIWVCDLANNVLGFGELPTSTHTNTYGVVIDYKAFGYKGSSSFPYNLGRTCTHEISHCFRLLHVWGDDGGGCSGSDYVNDTPNQGDNTFGCVSYPALDGCTNSGAGIMFMNYMDYSDDACMNMFTKNQASRMFTAINMYYPTLLSSAACQSSTGIGKVPTQESFKIGPSPSSTGIFNIDMTDTKDLGTSINIRVTDILGKIISEEVVQDPTLSTRLLDLRDESEGIYFITVYDNNYNQTVKVTISK
jgi:hypothetical protein